MKVKFNDERQKSKAHELWFTDLELNESFNIKGCPTVYRKIQHKNSDSYYMLEESTGKFFPPTNSIVETLNKAVEITVK